MKQITVVAVCGGHISFFHLPCQSIFYSINERENTRGFKVVLHKCISMKEAKSSPHTRVKRGQIIKLAVLEVSTVRRSCRTVFEPCKDFFFHRKRSFLKFSEQKETSRTKKHDILRKEKTFYLVN